MQAIEQGRVTFKSGRIAVAALARSAGVCRDVARAYLRGEFVSDVSAAACRRALERAGFAVVSAVPEDCELSGDHT